MRIQFRGNITLYMLDLFCTITAIGLLGFAIYIFPYVVLGIVGYDVPQFVKDMAHWYEVHHSFSGTMIAMLMFLPLILASIALFFVARMIAFHIETSEEVEPGVPHIDKSEYESHLGRVVTDKGSGSKKATWVVISLIFGIFAILFISEYFLLTQIIV